MDKNVGGLSYDDILRTLRKIEWGKDFIEIEGQTFILSHPTIKQSNHLDFIYQQQLELCEGTLASRKELERYYISLGEWTGKEKEGISELRNKIDEIKEQLAGIKKTAKTIRTINQLNKSLKFFQTQLSDLVQKEYELFKDCA